MKDTLTKFEQARYHTTALQRLGYAVEGVLVQIQALEELEEQQVPDDLAKRYQVPTECPRTEEHLVNGVPQVLRAEVMWAGHHYSLSPGQRQWLRDFAGLTPAMTVTLEWVQVWKGTQHPRSFKMVSDQHVDPRLRRHMLTALVVRDAGRFFAESAEIDRQKEEEREGDTALQGSTCPKGKTAKTPKAELESFEKMLGEMGIG